VVGTQVCNTNQGGTHNACPLTFEGVRTMLLCAVCRKVIADVDPSTIRYGGCGKCALEDVEASINRLRTGGTDGSKLPKDRE